MAIRIRGHTLKPEHLLIVAFASLLALAVVQVAVGAPRSANDFYVEGTPAYLALSHGHVLSFLQLGDVYAGSLELRAPFAMVAALFGASTRTVYYASAIPCMLALVAFAVWVSSQPRRGGHSMVARITPVLCCVATPYVFISLTSGHPEQLLSTTLCVAGVFAARDNRPALAGLLVGLAAADKEWAVVAVPVVIAVLPAARRRALLVAGATMALLLAPAVLARQQHFASNYASTTGSGPHARALFLPPQLLWFLGSGSTVAKWAHPLIIAVSLALGALWWWLRRPERQSAQARTQEALLLLALLFMLRCALDPWDNITYAIPFVLVLLTCEARAGRAPVLTVLSGIALYMTMQTLFGVVSNDARAGLFAAVAVPTMILLGARVYLGWTWSGRAARESRAPLEPAAAVLS